MYKSIPLMFATLMLFSGDAGATVSDVAGAAARHAGGAESRELSFYHTHTRKRLTIEYFRDGSYVDGALRILEAYLGDFRNGETRELDPALFDLLFEIKVRSGTQQPFHIVSAYRSPDTNAMLKKAGRGVATRSMHIEGRAIDIRLTDVAVDELRTIALALARGGVGYYPKSNFIHVDTGRVRRW